jgi:hypothetical protein
LPEVRSAIIKYWHNVTGVDMNEQRWDVYPLGFDKNNQERILVCAYAYTGDLPAFLGTWAVDVNGEKCELVDLEGTNYQVSTVGFKLVHDSYNPREFVEWESKRLKKIEKKKEKAEKRQMKAMQRAHKKVYREKLRMLRRDYRFKLKEYKKSKKKGLTSSGGDDQINVDMNQIENQDIDYEKFNKEREELIRKQQEELNQKKNKNKKGVNKGANKGVNNKVKETPKEEVKEQSLSQPQTQQPQEQIKEQPTEQPKAEQEVKQEVQQTEQQQEQPKEQ